MDSLRYSHIRNASDHPVLTVAVDISNLAKPAREPLEVKYAFAICSPLDQFSRTIGRNICAGRFQKGAHTLWRVPEAEVDGYQYFSSLHGKIFHWRKKLENLHDVSRLVAFAVKNYSATPPHAVAAIEHYLDDPIIDLQEPLFQMNGKHDPFFLGADLAHPNHDRSVEIHVPAE